MAMRIGTCCFLLCFGSSLAAAQACKASVANKPGDTIQVTATLFSTDPNENGEGEPLSIASASGTFSTVVGFYNSPQNFSYVASQAGEVINGIIIGADGDETCTISAAVTNSPRYTPAQKAQFTALSNQANLISARLAVVTALCSALALIPGATPVAIICAVGFGFDSGSAWVLAAKYQILAADPPDPNFMQIATPFYPPPTPAPQSLPPTVAAALNEFRSDLSHVFGLQGALITSINRASGAQVANDTYWTNLQNQTVNTYNDQLSGSMARTAAAAQALQLALQAANATYTTTTAESSSFESYVSRSGLPPQVVYGIMAYFGTPADVTSAANIAIVQDQNALAGPLTGPNGLLAGFSSSLLSVSQSIGGACTTVNMVRSGFGQTMGQPGYISNADLNKDGVVNVSDLAMASRALPAGTNCP